VDIVVNNAGYFPNRSIDEIDLFGRRDHPLVWCIGLSILCISAIAGAP
jgi:hypothetical protein